MSQVYSTEPQTSGRVILETTHGPIDIQLFCKECPSTTKLFLQLCLDGYYNDMIFHRIVPNFLIQTGAVRNISNIIDNNNTGNLLPDEYKKHIHANESIERQSYELNSRIRFNHRGQVAMATNVENNNNNNSQLVNDNNDDELQGQFFITLEEAPYLDAKHVIFGTVSGPTVFNALRIGRVELDNNNNNNNVMMDDTPKIQQVKIIDNPIHTSLVPTSKLSFMPWQQQQQQQQQSKNNAAKKRKKKKGIKNINVLSFGEEMQQDEEIQGGIQSSHDIIDSSTDSKSKLSKQVDPKLQQQLLNNESKNNNENTKQEPKSNETIAESNIQQSPTPDSPQDYNNDNNDNDKNDNNNDSDNVELTNNKVTYKKSKSIETEPSNETQPKQESQTTKNSTTENDKMNVTKQQQQSKSLVEQRRLKYMKKQKPTSKRQREEDTMSKLFAFQRKVMKTSKNNDENGSSDQKDTSLASRMFQKKNEDPESQLQQEQEVDASNQHNVQPTYHGQVLDDDNNNNNDDRGTNNDDWLKTKFKCKKHMDHDSRMGSDGRDKDDYKVVDGRADKDHKYKKHHENKSHHRRHDKHSKRHGK